ncbi:hypothetical protein PhCBS80983_g06458 [Powellomyces hirtus]|uniref:Reverse transcriptase domain-containing protein n=1 Tax=Powellomyces hirtus TaxID=109895 RepID=A0A507DNC3_9FUNG|nr:hypothetical protein PhCBS80983_g06458 [Powellomyces hirtus]
MAAPGPAAWTLPAVGPAPQNSDRLSELTLQTTLIANTKTIPYFSGEHNMELIDLFVTTNVRACNHLVTAHTGIGYNEFNYFDKYAVTNMNPSVVAWHTGIMNPLRVRPVAPTEGVAAWWAAQFYQRWMPRNVTSRLHQEMAALSLGNSLEDYIRKLERYRHLETIAVRANGNATERFLLEGEMIDLFCAGLLCNSTYGLYLVQALQNFMTMSLTIGQPVTWPVAVICVRNAAAASRNLVDGYLTTPARTQAKTPTRSHPYSGIEQGLVPLDGHFNNPHRLLLEDQQPKHRLPNNLFLRHLGEDLPCQLQLRLHNELPHADPHSPELRVLPRRQRNVGTPCSASDADEQTIRSKIVLPKETSTARRLKNQLLAVATRSDKSIESAELKPTKKIKNLRIFWTAGNRDRNPTSIRQIDLRTRLQPGKASSALTWVFRVKIGTEPIIALLDTGCNTTVVQDPVANKRKFEKRPFNKPYDIDTAGAGQTIRITSFMTQLIQIFNNTSQNYDPVASFHFEIAPIGIPLILGLPFFEAIGTFTCITIERPHRILFTLDGKTFNCSSLPSKRHTQSPDSFIRKAQTFTIHGAAKDVKRERQKPFQSIAAVSTKRFNKQLQHKQYHEAFAIHIRANTEKNKTKTEPSWPKFLDSVLQRFKNTLFKETDDLPPDCGNNNFHVDIVPGSKPVFQALRPISQDQLGELRKQLDHLLLKGWIQHSKSPWGASVVFAVKKTGGIRVCWDYRRLNAIMIKDCTPLPNLREMRNQLLGAHFYTLIDLKDAYHQLLIAPEDREKTAIHTRFGLFEYVLMPFGLCNAPGAFQRLMNQVLGDLYNIYVICYLDDIFIFSPNPSKHRQDRDAEIAAPLSALQGVKSAFEWTAKEQKAFDALKAAVTSAPVLATFNLDQPIYVHTDSSGYAISGWLGQTDNGEPLPMPLPIHRVRAMEKLPVG